MEHAEQRIYLIKALLAEQPKYGNVEIPEDVDEQKRLLRSLMNIRHPWPVSREILDIQDKYLSEEVRLKGIVDGDGITAPYGGGRVALWLGDITTLRVDAIVNAANSGLRGCFVPCHACIDNCIHSASGIQLRLACDAIMREQGHEEPTGTARITPAFNLPCKYVLHTVGPIVSGQLTDRCCGQLASSYRSCLELAAKNRLKSLAFCCISTGEFRFPNEKAAEIAVETVSEFLKKDTTIEKVIFNVFKQKDYKIYTRLLGELLMEKTI